MGTEEKMKVTHQAKEGIRWWIRNLPQAKKQVAPGKPTIILTSDASNSGWGG